MIHLVICSPQSWRIYTVLLEDIRRYFQQTPFIWFFYHQNRLSPIFCCPSWRNINLCTHLAGRLCSQPWWWLDFKSRWRTAWSRRRGRGLVGTKVGVAGGSAVKDSIWCPGYDLVSMIFLRLVNKNCKPITINHSSWSLSLGICPIFLDIFFFIFPVLKS